MGSTSIGIAGAGLIGRLLAHRLQRAGHQVSLFDADAMDRGRACAHVAAGMLAPFAELEKAEAVISHLGAVSLDLWEAWLGDSPVFHQRTGSLVVTHPADAAELRLFLERLRRAGVQAPHLQRMDAAALANLEPELAGRFSSAVYFPEEGHLDPRELMPFLLAELKAHGAQLHPHTAVTDVQAGAIVTGGQTHRFDWALDCRGLEGWIAQSRPRGVRGEIIRVHAPEVVLRRPVRLMHPRYPLYVVPRRDAQFLIGATSIESADAGPITVRAALELLSAAYSLHPGFAEARLLEVHAACRPALPDNLPRIHVTPGRIQVNGLYRHGFLIAPALVQDIHAVIDGSEPKTNALFEVHHAETHG